MSPFIVAELSCNHLGSLERALAIMDAAADAGADAVKLQWWSANTMAGNRHIEIKSGPWAGRKMADLYHEAWTPWLWYGILWRRARELGIELFAAAFDLTALDYLQANGVRRHKIASFELVDDELVAAAAKTGKPLILSTGMATFDEIRHAVLVAEEAGLRAMRSLTLLRCVSAYPAAPRDAGLGTMEFLRSYFSCKVGLSDHTLGTAVSVAAVARGATMIEKHLTIKRSDGGPDAAFSLEPDEFRTLVADCRAAFEACGETTLGPNDDELPQLALRRSLWWAMDVSRGTQIQREMVRSARPADGLPCYRLPGLLQSRTRRSVTAGDPVMEEDG